MGRRLASEADQCMSLLDPHVGRSGVVPSLGSSTARKIVAGKKKKRKEKRKDFGSGRAMGINLLIKDASR